MVVWHCRNAREEGAKLKWAGVWRYRPEQHSPSDGKMNILN